jgi:hypothetical protein
VGGGDAERERVAVSKTYPCQKFLFAVRGFINDWPVTCLGVIGDAARRGFTSDDDLYERLGIQETRDGITIALKEPGLWVWEGDYEFYPGSTAGGFAQDADDAWGGEIRPATVEDLAAFGMGVGSAELCDLRSELAAYFDLKQYLDGPLGGPAEWERFQRSENALRAILSRETPTVLRTNPVAERLAALEGALDSLADAGEIQITRHLGLYFAAVRGEGGSVLGDECGATVADAVTTLAGKYRPKTPAVLSTPELTTHGGSSGAITPTLNPDKPGRGGGR